MQVMTPNQPYLLRAFFDWILDNGLSPYIVVNANRRGVEVPLQFVKDGQIVLNVAPSACINFHIDLDGISFQARFGGQPMVVRLPCSAVSAIYAKENGAGTVFTEVEDEPQEETLSSVETSPNAPALSEPRKPAKPNFLKVVK